MDPVQFVKDNLRAVLVGTAVWIVAAGLWRHIDRAHEYGLVPLAVGVVGFIVARRYWR